MKVAVTCFTDNRTDILPYKLSAWADRLNEGIRVS
jgi:hypothetical protein